MLIGSMSTRTILAVGTSERWSGIEVKYDGGISPFGCALLTDLFQKGNLSAAVEKVRKPTPPTVVVGGETFKLDPDCRLTPSSERDDYLILYIISPDGRSLFIDDLHFGGTCSADSTRIDFDGPSNVLHSPGLSTPAGLPWGGGLGRLLPEYINRVTETHSVTMLPRSGWSIDEATEDRAKLKADGGTIGAQFLFVVPERRIFYSADLLQFHIWSEVGASHGLDEQEVVRQFDRFVRTMSKARLGRVMSCRLSDLFGWELLDEKTHVAVKWPEFASIQRMLIEVAIAQ